MLQGGAQHGMGFRVCRDLRKESCILSTAINGANKGPKVNASQGAWQVGRTPLGKLYIGILVSRSGERLRGEGCPMARLGRAVQGSRAGRGVLLSGPSTGRDKSRGLEAASIGCEPRPRPE